MSATISDWVTCAGERGSTVPDSTASAQALVRAEDYINYSYVARFIYPFDATSPNVEDAIYEAANLELKTVGFFTKTFTPSEQKTLTEVKGIKWTVTGGKSNERAALLATPRSTLIDAMLAPYMPLENGFAPFLKTVGAQSE